MPKSKTAKQATVTSLTQGIKEAKSTVFANFQGLTVAQSEDLRKQSRGQKVTVLATKKTLMQRALEEAGLGDVDAKAFKGGVAVFMGEDEVTPAKVVATFAKKHDLVTIFGGILDGKFIDSASVKSLALLPGKQELLGKLVGSMNAPISGFVMVQAGILRSLLNVLNARKDKLPA
jgi:large subunit ribosomal protein L10